MTNVLDSFKLNGRIALVTGGAGKYGACIARGLAEAGASVIIASRQIDLCEAKASEMRTDGLDTRADQVDIADEESVKALRDRILSERGQIDILVNNAVGRPWTAPTSPAEVWRESMKVNAIGTFIITSAFLGPMVERRSGNIINIASMFGLIAQDPHIYEGTGLDSDPYGDYFFHKAGLIHYTRYLAARYAEHNIRVNCISPGGFFASQPPKFVENYNRRTPLGRMANDDDIKGAVVYLASDASSYVTGENLVVDGGRTIW